ncbi:MAG: hypothetical protein ABIV93_27020 [Byssovorax sp.]
MSGVEEAAVPVPNRIDLLDAIGHLLSDVARASVAAVLRFEEETET